MTQPKWAQELRRRKTKRFAPTRATVVDAIDALRDIIRQGNRRPLRPSERDALAQVLQDSKPPHQEDPYTQGFIRRTVFRLGKGGNLFAEQAKRALVTIHDWHKDNETSNLATESLKALYSDRETWYL